MKFKQLKLMMNKKIKDNKKKSNNQKYKLNHKSVIFKTLKN